MPDRVEPRLPRLPFFIGDALLLGLAFFLNWQGHAPLSPGELAAITVCVVAGACLGVGPYVLEYRAASRVLQAAHFDSAVQRIESIQEVSQQISSATACWQAVQDDSSKALQSAHEISEQMSAEAQAFRDFFAKSNEAERNHLRLEVEKLRRAEGDWLQVLVRILDHVYALHQAAVRSGHAGLVDQLGTFQRVCRDVARRVGLVAHVPRHGEVFDPDLHQADPPNSALPPDPRVVDTLAAGYRFQGQIIRKAAVALQGGRTAATDLSISVINQRRGGSQPSNSAVAAATEPADTPPPAAEPKPPSEPSPDDAPAVEPEHQPTLDPS